MDFATAQEAINKYWTKENDLSCQDWHGELDKKVFQIISILS